MNLIVNGDFESGDISGWDVRYAKVKNATNLKGDLRRFPLYGNPEPDHPRPAIVDNSTVLPSQSAPITPFQGANMLRINGLDGGEYATCVEQSFVLPADFKIDCGFVAFSWGAMLTSGHSEIIRRPKFSFSVSRKKGSKWKRIAKAQVIAVEAAVDGWSDIRKTGAQDAVWYKSGTEKLALTGVLPGDRLRIQFLAEDCIGGGHGGAAFIDDVMVSDGCDAGAAAMQPISLGDPPNVFTPNGDGQNDVWGLTNVMGACRVEIDVFDRWGDPIFHNRQSSMAGTWPSFLPLWDGIIRTKQGVFKKRKSYHKRKIRKADMDNDVVFYQLTLENCHEVRYVTGFTHVYP